MAETKQTESSKLLPERATMEGSTGNVHGISSTDMLHPPQSREERVTGKLVFSIFAAVLGMFQFGYNTAVINAPQSVIKAFYNQTYLDRNDEVPDGSTLDLLWATTVAIFAVGGMFGGLLGGWWAERFGRKKGMMINTVFGIAAGALMGFAELGKSYEMIIIGRFIVGFNCGLYTGLSPIYNSEVSPVSIRGAVGTVNQLSVTIAMLIAQVLGLQEIMGTEELWPLLLGLTALWPLLQLVTLPFAPESPRYLLLTKDKEDDAYRALVELRGTEDVRWEMEEMVSERASSAGEKTYSMWELIKSSSLRMPLVVAIMMHLSQQLSGINCIFYYSTSLFTSVGLEEDEATYATTSVGGIMVIMTLVSIPLMDRAGRRTLHLVGLGGMCVLSIAFTISFDFASRNDDVWLQYFAIVSALIIVVFFAIGPGSIPWMIVTELFSQGPRAAAVNIGVLVNWFANFIVGLTFPSLENALKELVFVPYTVLLAFFFAFLYKTLPETKGKTFEEISALFNKGNLSAEPSKEAKDALGLEGKYASFSETDAAEKPAPETESKLED